MSIAMEFYNIVFRKSVIAAKYPGGIDHLRKIGGPTHLEDDYLVRGGAMNWHDVLQILNHFQNLGFQYIDENGKAQDMVVVDMTKGPLTPCDWIEFHVGDDGPVCWMKGTDPGTLSKYAQSDDPSDVKVVFEARCDTLVPVNAFTKTRQEKQEKLR